MAAEAETERDGWVQEVLELETEVGRLRGALWQSGNGCSRVTAGRVMVRAVLRMVIGAAVAEWRGAAGKAVPRCRLRQLERKEKEREMKGEYLLAGVD